MTIISKIDDQSTAAKNHAIIIGAGFGGLAAAIRLLAKGYRVTIVERLEQAGGRASVFRQDGFTFDAGPTIVTAPFIMEELWSLFDEKMEDDLTLKALDPFYKIRFHDGDEFLCNGDPDFMEKQIAKFEPSDVKGYHRYFKESKENFVVGFDLMDKPFHRLWDMLTFVPRLALNRADLSVFGHVKKHIKNKKLRIALSFHPLFVGGNPLNVTSIYSLIAYLERTYGVHYAMGGTGALVEAMVKLFTRHGGTILYNAPVNSLIVDGDKAQGVVLESGERITSDIVVANADSHWVYRNLITKKPKKRWSRKKIDKLHYSMSLFVWYFGTNKKYDDVEHHTILMGPRYEGLLKDIFDNHVLAEDFSLYLHRPTATDPSVAPEGHDGFYVLAPVPHLAADVNWTEEGESYRKRIETVLENAIMPGLSDAIVTSKIMTPEDFRDRLNAPTGAAFGPQPLFTQSGWFRPHNKSEELENLYLVGAGTHPGAGLPGVITSGKVVANMIKAPENVSS